MTHHVGVSTLPKSNVLLASMALVFFIALTRTVSAQKISGRWQFQTIKRGWVDYDSESNAEIEAANRGGKPSVVFCYKKREYEVDFTTLKQTNVTGGRRFCERRVQRKEVSQCTPVQPRRKPSRERSRLLRSRQQRTTRTVAPAHPAASPTPNPTLASANIPTPKISTDRPGTRAQQPQLSFQYTAKPYANWPASLQHSNNYIGAISYTLGGKPLNVSEFADNLATNEYFRGKVIDSLRDDMVRDKHYYLRGPCVDAGSKDSPFYWVLKETSFPSKPDHRSFAVHLDRNNLTFTSRSGNTLVIPQLVAKDRQSKAYQCRHHIATFMTDGDAVSKSVFWECVGEEMIRRFKKTNMRAYRPQTHGKSVPYLHFRFDKDPKQYGNAFPGMDTPDFYNQVFA